MTKIKIAVAKGDGIGPEIMDAVLEIFKHAEVPLEYDFVEMGKDIFLAGNSSGMTEEAKDIVEKRGILFKGPMETPKGSGMKSINVTARKVWNTYANIRKFRSLSGVDTVFSRANIPVDLTVVRENIEDTYGGIEYLTSPDTALAHRIISKPGCEQVIRFTFELAKKEGAKKVTCGHKSNIMKLTDGLFMETFYEIAKEYPDIITNDVIIDDLAMKLVTDPGRFDIIVLTNLQGDIMSDLCAGLVGGLGFAPSANIGDNIAIFEAVHGTAPDIAGKNIANPTSLLLSGLMMLKHIGAASIADMIENSLLYTLEQGIHTRDFGDKNKEPYNTEGFAKKIIEHFGKKPDHAVPRKSPEQKIQYTPPLKPDMPRILKSKIARNDSIQGVDINLIYDGNAEHLAEEIQKHLPINMKLDNISNRGTQVWPDYSVFTDCITFYRLRIFPENSKNITADELISLAADLSKHFEVSDITLLKEINGRRGYSLAQGQ